MRFRPEQHLRRQSDFRAVREQGRRVNGGAFTLSLLTRPANATVGADVRRVGFVASTSAVGHAVLRNRAKRRLREVFRQHQLAVPAGCDIVLVARAATVTLPIRDLERKFLDACRQFAPSAQA